jgi:hypothetical protein
MVADVPVRVPVTMPVTVMMMAVVMAVHSVAAVFAVKAAVLAAAVMAAVATTMTTAVLGAGDGRTEHGKAKRSSRRESQKGGFAKHWNSPVGPLGSFPRDRETAFTGGSAGPRQRFSALLAARVRSPFERGSNPAKP